MRKPATGFLQFEILLIELNWHYSVEYGIHVDALKGVFWAGLE